MRNINLITALRIVEFDASNPPIDNQLGKINFDNIPNKANFLEIPFTLETGGFTDEMQQTRAGIIFDKSVTCKVPRHYTTFEQSMKRFYSKPVVALCTDANNVTHLLFPLLFSMKKGIQGTIANYRGYELNLTGKGEKSAFFVNNIPFDTEFTGIPTTE